MEPELLVVCLTDNASIPSRAHEKDAGLDLRSAENVTIEKGRQSVVSTGIAIKIPEGYYGRIAERSGLSSRGIGIGGGVIDEDYRGQVKIIVKNGSDSDFVIDVGDKIAQLICEKICKPRVIVVSELDSTARNENGFGSTG